MQGSIFRGITLSRWSTPGRWIKNRLRTGLEISAHRIVIKGDSAKTKYAHLGKLVLFQNITLDGVMQAPGRPDEDPRGGFPYGGWATPYADPELGKAAEESMSTTGGTLLGRRTYEDLYSVWPNRTDNPFTEVLNNTPKYVASRTLQEPLPWMNSVLLIGDVPDAVATLKNQQEKNLVVMGN